MIKKLYIRLLDRIQIWARRRSYRQAVKSAVKENRKTGRKVLVVLYQGEFVALTKRRLKKWRKAGIGSKDFVAKCEKHAVFIAK